MALRLMSYNAPSCRYGSMCGCCAYYSLVVAHQPVVGDDIIVEEETIVRGCGFHGAVPGRARAATDLPDDAQPEAGNKAVQHRARRVGGAAHHNDHLRRLHRLMAERLQAG